MDSSNTSLLDEMLVNLLLMLSRIFFSSAEGWLLCWWTYDSLLLGPTISNHTKQHCRNKWSMITPEAWTPVTPNSQCSSTEWIEHSTKYVLPRIQIFIIITIYKTPKEYMQRWMGKAVTTHVRGHMVCTGFALKKLMKKRLVLSVLHEIQWWKRHHWQKRAFNP